MLQHAVVGDARPVGRQLDALALQLLIWTMSESMRDHASKMVGADGVD
jgi:hypothetical protein